MMERLDNAEQADAADQPPHNTLHDFGKLVVEHQSRVRNYIRSLGVASCSVDDIAQEAFVVALKHFATFKYGTSFPAWVNSIARNLVLNDLHKTNRRFKLLNEAASGHLIEADPPYDMAQKEDSDIKREALRKCMDEIPEKQRELLHLRYQGEIEPAQLAKQLDLNHNTLRTQLLRLRQALGKCIRKRLGMKLL